MADEYARRILGESLAKERRERGGPRVSFGEVDFEDPNLVVPSCVFCRKPFSIIEGRKPYVLPCGGHRSCKKCLL